MNNFCDVFENFGVPYVECTGSNYNDYNEDYVHDSFKANLTNDDLRGKDCLDQCADLGRGFVDELGDNYFSATVREMSSMVCYFYQSAEGYEYGYTTHDYEYAYLYFYFLYVNDLATYQTLPI